MNELEKFAFKINDICRNRRELSIENAREIVKEINDFLYTNYEGIGVVNALDTEYEYFSDFHKYWDKNHREILNLQINEQACEQVADCLHEVFIKTDGKAFLDLYDTNGLSKEDICRVRFLTANQDFRGSRDFSVLSSIFKNDPDIFDEHYIAEHPEQFISDIRISDLSQNDKRVNYAKKVCDFLIKHNTTPIGLIERFEHDVYKLRTNLINYGAGYGNKKTDMFIRDMVVLGIWENVEGFEKIDIASDVNTIKVALRTGILTSEIPLLSSFLDIFCYQYAYVDEMNALAWRKVWEIWSKKYPSQTLSSPSLLDYFIYRIVGKDLCKTNLFLYQCENRHRFFWNSKRKKICPTCHGEVKIVKSEYLCDETDGRLITNEILPEFNNCPFKEICDANNKKRLNSPKVISIKGQTGWESAYTERDNGGGGIMG